MTKTEKAISLLAAFILAIGLSACGTAIDDGAVIPADEVYEFMVTRSDGSTMDCVKIRETYGITCDFGGRVR